MEGGGAHQLELHGASGVCSGGSVIVHGRAGGDAAVIVELLRGKAQSQVAHGFCDGVCRTHTPQAPWQHPHAIEPAQVLPRLVHVQRDLLVMAC
eukprot:2367007-Prymnesium_polylepis.2